MKAFVLGTPDDVRGFALAGIKGVACESEGDVDRALAALAPELTLLIVSEPVVGLCGDKLAKLPIQSLVLP